MLISIILAATLLFVSFSIGSSYEAAQRKMAKGMSGSASVSITHIDHAMPIQEEEIPNVEGLQAKLGIMKTSGLYHEEGYYETIDLIAADLECLQEINAPRLVTGETLKELRNHEIILPTRFTDKYGLKKGDQITLKVAGKEITFTLAEIGAYDTVFLRQTRGTNGLVSLETMQEILNSKSVV